MQDGTRGGLHALEVLPDETGTDVVHRDWQTLSDAGLPSQLDHRGPSNAPHVTLVSAPDISPSVEALAIDLIEPLLPLQVRICGVLLLGGTKLTVARAMDVDDDLARAVVDIRAVTSGRQHVGWLPHVTLARRLPREDAQRAVDVLGYDDLVLTLDRLRRWDPSAGTATTLTN